MTASPEQASGSSASDSSARQSAAQDTQVNPNAAGHGVVRRIKKYPNRRLYDTHTSAYITLTDVKQLVLDSEDFAVEDAKSGEDLTRSILLQIILEEESGGVPLFSSLALRQIIRFYGHSMQGVMGSFLEKNIQAFMEIQERFVEQSRGLYGAVAAPVEEALGASLGQPPGTQAWAQFMTGQMPMMQGMMENYVEQSKNLFVQMQAQLQDQMQGQVRSLFSAFPFAPPAPTPAPKAAPKADTKNAPNKR